MSSIAFITTCKGRLPHLKETLPLMAAQGPDELIVVDYSCRDQAGEWVEAEFPQATVVRVPDQAGFNLGKARNHGAAVAKSDWLFFVDADMRMAPNFGAELGAALKPGHFYRPLLKEEHDPWEMYGSFCCPAKDFAELEGYDEIIDGWGFEDQDLYDRLELRGLRQTHYSNTLLEVIHHDDSARATLSNMTDRWQNEAVNGCYSHLKRAISMSRGAGGTLSLRERRKLMETISKIVDRWYGGQRLKPLKVRIPVQQTRPHTFGSLMEVHADTAVTLILKPPPEPEEEPR